MTIIETTYYFAFIGLHFTFYSFVENEWKSCLVHNVIRKPDYVARDGFIVTLVYFYRFRVWLAQSICLDYVAGRYPCML